MGSPLSNISTSLKSLDKDISDLSGSIDKLNTNTSSFNSIGNKIKDTTTNALSNFAGLKTVVDGLGITFETFEAEVTAGLSVLITFAPEILNWISSLTKGKEAITQAKLSLETLNKAFQSSDYSNAIKQMDEMKINVSLAIDGQQESIQSNSLCQLA